MQQEHLELADVSIRIPVPSGVGAPVVGSCDGDYNHDSRKNFLEWKLPVIGTIFIFITSSYGILDSSNSSGSLEFSIAGNPDDFFPVNVSSYLPTGINQALDRFPLNKEEFYSCRNWRCGRCR